MMSGLNLDWVVVEFSAVTPGQLSSPSLGPWRANQQSSYLVFFLSFVLDEVNGLSCGLGVSAALDPLADCFSDGFEDLVVPPSIPALTQCLGAAAQDVFQCPCFGTQGACRCFYFAPCA